MRGLSSCSSSSCRSRARTRPADAPTPPDVASASLTFPPRSYADVRLAEPPFVRQKPDFCGEACVSMAALRLGRQLTRKNDVFGLARRRSIRSGAAPIRPSSRSRSNAPASIPVRSGQSIAVRARRRQAPQHRVRRAPPRPLSSVFRRSSVCITTIARARLEHFRPMDHRATTPRPTRSSTTSTARGRRWAGARRMARARASFALAALAHGTPSGRWSAFG